MALWYMVRLYHADKLGCSESWAAKSCPCVNVLMTDGMRGWAGGGHVALLAGWRSAQHRAQQLRHQLHAAPHR